MTGVWVPEQTGNRCENVRYVFVYTGKLSATLAYGTISADKADTLTGADAAAATVEALRTETRRLEQSRSLTVVSCVIANSK